MESRASNSSTAQTAKNGGKPATRVGRLVRRGLPIAVLLAVLAGIVVYLRLTDHGPQRQIASHDETPIPVNVITVEPATIPMQMRFLGQTEAAQSVEIRSRVVGYLQQRTFVEGEVVEPGQMLFRIDPRPFEVALAEAQARLASGEATLAQAQQNLQRIRDAHAVNAASQNELDQAIMRERVAAAEVELAKAQIAAAQLQIDYTTIESPIRGRIGRALRDVGSYVDAGQNGLLAVVQQVDPMYVRYSVTETEMLRFQRQLTANQIIVPDIDAIELEVTLADGTVYPYRGRINFVDVQVDLATGTTVIRGEVPNPDGMLRPGQFIHASVLGIERVNAIRVPQSAVTRSPMGAAVMVVNDEGRVEPRPVVLGEWSGEHDWIIESGLFPGDRVIIDRLTAIRPGMAVEPMEASHLTGASAGADAGAADAADETGEASS